MSKIKELTFNKKKIDAFENVSWLMQIARDFIRIFVLVSFPSKKVRNSKNVPILVVNVFKCIFSDHNEKKVTMKVKKGLKREGQ